MFALLHPSLAWLFGAVLLVFAALALGRSKRFLSFRKAGPKAPYDAPASLNPRMDAYARMVDPGRDRPRHYR